MAMQEEAKQDTEGGIGGKEDEHMVDIRPGTVRCRAIE